MLSIDGNRQTLTPLEMDNVTKSMSVSNISVNEAVLINIQKELKDNADNFKDNVAVSNSTSKGMTLNILV